MGNLSWLFATRNGANKCKIDWSKCPELNRYGACILEEMRTENSSSTLQEIAEAFDDSKLFGYLTAQFIKDLITVNKLLTGGDKYMPRLYYEYEGWFQLNYLEFHPGTDVIMIGTC